MLSVRGYKGKGREQEAGGSVLIDGGQGVTGIVVSQRCSFVDAVYAGKSMLVNHIRLPQAKSRTLNTMVISKRSENGGKPLYLSA
jgi:hypothetical protein